MNSEEMVRLCREHTLYTWTSGQAVDPIPVARAEGIGVPANTPRSGGRHPEDYSYGYSDGLEARRLRSQ